MYEFIEEIVSSAFSILFHIFIIFLFILVIPIATIFRLHYRLQSEKCPRCNGRYRTQLVHCSHVALQYHCYTCGNGWFINR